MLAYARLLQGCGLGPRRPRELSSRHKERSATAHVEGLSPQWLSVEVGPDMPRSRPTRHHRRDP